MAHLKPPPGAGLSGAAQSEIQRVAFENPGIDVSETRTRAWRGAEIPAAGGTGNARSIATVQAILANGGVMNGKGFLSEAGCRKALECPTTGDMRAITLAALVWQAMAG